ncbi:hypothetical protein QVD17_27362 [Tagetes erecta]|uniref:BHLH domain-containing protein n=1 Tax=Tagetes erecta TaxID=13708 RepID=A0AAD8NR07_TARER|nr:hypothetical protein QVD17_27362 [Tagetes erecta]
MGHEEKGFFWEAYPWVVMSEKSTGASASGNEKKTSSVVDDNSLLDLSIGSKNHSHMKKPKVEDANGGSCNRNDNGKRKVEEASDDHLLTFTERGRRKKMRNMFNQLHALLPQLQPKVDKYTVVDEAIGYIKSLQQTLQNLETKKQERLYGVAITNSTTNGSLLQPQRSECDTSYLANQGSSTGQISFPRMVFRTWGSSNVTFNVCGVDAHINICSTRKPGLFTTICLVLEELKLEIVSAHVTSDESKTLFMIHAHGSYKDVGSKYDEVVMCSSWTSFIPRGRRRR